MPLKETYSDSENTSETFEIEAALHDLRQGDLSVTQYFNTLSRHWQQLDLLEVHSWTCPNDTELYRRIVEQKRTFKFLLGLNKNLDEVRGRIMGTKPLLKIREAFSEVRREESRKKVMMGTQSPAPLLEGSALAARGPSPNSYSENRQQKGRPWCDNCQRPGHNRETCWKLHGKPADWKPRKTFKEKESRAHYTTAAEETPAQIESCPFTKEQLDMLQKLLHQNPASNLTSGTGMLAHKGKLSNAFTVNKQHGQQWIIDSGASDHMTGDRTVFHDYSPRNENYTVRIADGSLSKVAGIAN
ncbi:uncharacterized protein [Henckelia pumila]|uniref:uncharacterized protein n=1 Tax=Henckelia pumila TaxID=405737 RepID=UPI003C6E3F48